MSTNMPGQTIIVYSPKSAGTAFALGLFFGPLGMLYSTGLGAVVMFVVTSLVAFFTLGFGLLVTQPVCAIWAAMAASSHNTRISQVPR